MSDSHPKIKKFLRNVGTRIESWSDRSSLLIAVHNQMEKDREDLEMSTALWGEGERWPSSRTPSWMPEEIPFRDDPPALAKWAVERYPWSEEIMEAALRVSPLDEKMEEVILSHYSTFRKNHGVISKLLKSSSPRALRLIASKEEGSLFRKSFQRLAEVAPESAFQIVQEREDEARRMLLAPDLAPLLAAPLPSEARLFLISFTARLNSSRPVVATPSKSSSRILRLRQ